MSNNPYEKLLQYLQNQKQVSKDEVIRKEKVEFTKELIESSKFYGFEPEENESSKFFSVDLLKEKFCKVLLDEFKAQQKYERPYISVDEICSCIRQCYYKRKKYHIDEKKFCSYPFVYLIRSIGISIHKCIQEVYDFDEIEKKIQIDKFMVRGRVDAIKGDTVFEIKTFDKFINQIQPEHYNQVNIYAYILNSEYDYKVDNLTLIYVSQNGRIVLPLDAKPRKDVAEKLLNRALILKSSLETHQVPDPFGSNDKLCTWCLYQKYCNQDGFNSVKPSFIKDTKDEKSDKRKPVFLL